MSHEKPDLVPVEPGIRYELHKTVVAEDWSYLGRLQGPYVKGDDSFKLEGDVYLHPDRPIAVIVSKQGQGRAIFLPDADPALMEVGLIFKTLALKLLNLPRNSPQGPWHP